VFWCEEEYCAKEVNIIRTDAENVSVCDIMGNVSQTPIIDEALTLQLSHSPSYLILDGAKTLLKAEIPLISFDSEAIVASPGKQISLSMTLRNPYRAAKTIQLQLQAPKGFELSGESQTVTLQPNIQKSVSCMVKVPSDYTARRAVLMLSYNLLLDNKVRGKCRIPINIAVKMPREHFPERPQFVLDKQKNVVTMMGHNPYTAHRLWSGPDDLSMKAWLCVTEKSLKINVLVKDDIFSPSSEAVNSYSCDGIQMAFAVPGQDAYWEIGLAQLKDASPAVYTWKMPSGFKDPSTMIDLKIKQEKQDTEYQIEIPLEALGITHAALTRGVKFNMIVNDNDGEGRDGWVEIAPGIGGSKKIDKFPFIVME
jgi:hypothetical protein